MEVFKSKEELCETLDKNLIEFFETLTELYQQQTSLEQTLKAGFLSLSRARYSMGVKSVDIGHVDETKMEALVKVDVKTEDDLNNLSDTFTVIHSNRSNEDCFVESIVDKVVGAEKEMNMSGLRKRITNTGSGDTTENASSINGQHIEEVNFEDNNKDEVKGTANEDRKIIDPIRWFGVLVPGSLKQSQTEFKKSTELAVTIGNLQTKLEKLRKNYKRLLLLKKNKFSESD